MMYCNLKIAHLTAQHTHDGRGHSHVKLGNLGHLAQEEETLSFEWMYLYDIFKNQLTGQK